MKKEVIAKFYLTYRLYIFPAIIALSSLILIVLIIFPQISKLISNNKVEGDLLNRSKNLEVKANELENYDALDLSKKVQITLSSYPGEKDFLNTIGLIQNIVAQSGFSIVNLSLGTSGSKVAGSEGYPIKLEVSGPKPLVSNLLISIENATRIMRVNTIDLSNTASQASNVSLDINILFAPVPSSFGNVDSPLPKLSEKEQDLLTKLASQSAPFIIPSIAGGENVQLPPRGKSNPFE